MIKRIWLILVSCTLLALLIVLVVVLDKQSTDFRRTIPCHKLEVIISDSTSLGFVNSEDVRNAIKNEYGTFIGQRIDSVNLNKIEKILNNKSAVLRSEAYTTLDGTLHIKIIQREQLRLC